MTGLYQTGFGFWCDEGVSAGFAFFFTAGGTGVEEPWVLSFRDLAT